MKKLKRLYYSISFRITLIIFLVCGVVSYYGAKIMSLSISIVSNADLCVRRLDLMDKRLTDKALQIENLLNAAVLTEKNSGRQQTALQTFQLLVEQHDVDSVYLIKENSAHIAIRESQAQADTARSVRWSEPYLKDGALKLTVSQKSNHKGTLLCADISLDWLNQIIKENLSEDELNFYVVSAGGKFLFHPDTLKIGSLAPEDKEYDKQSIVLTGLEQRFSSESLKVEQMGWEISCSAPVSKIVDSMSSVIHAVVLGQVASLVFVISMVILIFIRRLVKPLRGITDATEEISKGNFDIQLPVVKSRTEIRLLRDRFDRMQHELAQYMEDFKQATEQKASLERDLQIAHEIQQGMLPQVFPAFPERKDVDIYGLQIPARHVGGDLFDFYLRDDKLFFCIGDVSGKGVPAALFMAVTCRLFHYALRFTSDPKEIVSAINNELAQGNERNMFCTLFVAVLDMATGDLSYCNAGHNAPILIHEKDCSFMPCKSNIPAGSFENFNFQGETIHLQEGDALFLYTDVVTEAENLKKELYGDETTLAKVSSLCGTPMKLMAESMLGDILMFAEGAEQSDDLTILCLRYRP